MNSSDKKDTRHKCPCYYCSSANRPKDCYKSSKDYYSAHYTKKSKKGDGINGKRFTELEKESIFPQTEETGREFLSDRKKHEPALACPHGKKCHVYKHSYNKGHCEISKIFLETFQWGSEVGERWVNEKIPHLSKTPKALEVFQEDIKYLLKEVAQKPKTKANAWDLGFWHGALLYLQRISPED
uniref:Uncharacterized protein n=1 Tax=Sclerotheca viridiflora TaxID=2010906 RepID=A0A1Z2R631_9ASTR|nr:hypothetical protein Sc_vir1Pt0116 [Sclerotheca viridiflora]ASA39165.1 hypothetical protein Sc_vir1Pt0116 [Sclerotheca viridiflora]